MSGSPQWKGIPFIAVEHLKKQKKSNKLVRPHVLPAPVVSTVKVLVFPRKAFIRPLPLATHLLASEENFWRPLNLVVVLVLVTVSTTTEACSWTVLAWPEPAEQGQNSSHEPSLTRAHRMLSSQSPHSQYISWGPVNIPLLSLSSQCTSCRRKQKLDSSAANTQTASRGLSKNSAIEFLPPADFCWKKQTHTDQKNLLRPSYNLIQLDSGAKKKHLCIL